MENLVNSYELRFADVSHEMAVQKVISAAELVSLGHQHSTYAQNAMESEREEHLAKKESAYLLARKELRALESEQLGDAFRAAADALSRVSGKDYSWLAHLVGYGSIAAVRMSKHINITDDKLRILEGREYPYVRTEHDRCLGWNPEDHR